MNSKFVAEYTKRWAQRLLANDSHDDAGRVVDAYLAALGRPPTEEQVRQVLDYVNRIEYKLRQSSLSETGSRLQAWQSFCRIMVSTNEFIFVE